MSKEPKKNDIDVAQQAEYERAEEQLKDGLESLKGDTKEADKKKRGGDDKDAA